jgi:hypothetical protein
MNTPRLAPLALVASIGCGSTPSAFHWSDAAALAIPRLDAAAVSAGGQV